MDKYISCIAHNSSEGNLLVGDNYTALIDCGMAFCAKDTIQKVKDALNGRPLDYIFFTHTHYDHIGALPYFKKEWPDLCTVTTAVGAEVLLKNTPRRVIRELSLAAAQTFSNLTDTYFNTPYDDNVFRGDIIVKDGDSISLGSLTVEAVETPGHTRDSLCFFIPELEMLMLNETPGVPMPDGTVYPGYLCSCVSAINSIEKCRQIPYKLLSMPHRCIASPEDTAVFFDKALAATIACRDFILKMEETGLNEDEMLKSFFQQYSNETLLKYQPKEAFLANARAAISCTLRESY